MTFWVEFDEVSDNELFVGRIVDGVFYCHRYYFNYVRDNAMRPNQIRCDIDGQSMTLTYGANVPAFGDESMPFFNMIDFSRLSDAQSRYLMNKLAKTHTDVTMMKFRADGSDEEYEWMFDFGEVDLPHTTSGM